MNNTQAALCLSALVCVATLTGCGGNSTNTEPTAPRTVEEAPAANTAPSDGIAPAEKAAPMPTPLETPAAMSQMPTPAEKNAAPMPNAAQPTSYRVRGEVVEVMPAEGGNDAALTLKHEDIPGFMPAMQMRMPLANASDAAKVKAGDKITFDMNRDNTAVSNIEMLPASTELKLEK